MMQFSESAASKAALKQRVADWLTQQVATQPAHNRQVLAVNHAVAQHLDMLPEMEGKDFLVSIHAELDGQINNQESDYITTASLSVTAMLIAKQV